MLQSNFKVISCSASLTQPQTDPQTSLFEEFENWQRRELLQY